MTSESAQLGKDFNVIISDREILFACPRYATLGFQDNQISWYIMNRIVWNNRMMMYLAIYTSECVFIEKFPFTGLSHYAIQIGGVI